MNARQRERLREQASNNMDGLNRFAEALGKLIGAELYRRSQSQPSKPVSGATHAEISPEEIRSDELDRT